MVDNYPFDKIIAAFQLLSSAKMSILKQLNSVPNEFKTFFLDENSLRYKETEHEGYVVTYKGDTVKLINREEFSKMNFRRHK